MTETSNVDMDVVDILTADHQDMLELLRTIKNTADAEQRRDVADTVIVEVMRHAVAEEMIVYPAIEKHVPNGTEEVEHDKEGHDELVQLMKRMEDVDASDAVFMELVGELEQKLDHHAHDEEDDQIPKLRTSIPREELVEMGQKVQNSKKMAPTGPHPNAPHSELFHKTLGPGVGLVDRLRDKLTGRHIN